MVDYIIYDGLYAYILHIEDIWVQKVLLLNVCSSEKKKLKILCDV